MQPQSTQVPPSPSRSTTAVLSPSWAARIAPTYPAGPPPRKITSKDAMKGEPGREGPTDAATWRRASVHEHQRVLNQPPQRLEELGAHGPIDDPMVAAHGDAHAAAHDGLAVDDDELLLARADGEDPRLGRIDDRCELVDAEHAEVAHREGGSGELFRLELPLTRTLGELLR